MPDLITGVLAFIQARWKESGGYSLTPRLPATVEDTFHALRILSTLKAPAGPDCRQDRGLKDYLIRMKKTPGNDGRTTFHLLASCRLAGVPVATGETTRFIKARLAETSHLSERYYCARIVREVLGRPDAADGLDRLDDLYSRPWRTADELWMILYLLNGQKAVQELARRDDLVCWLRACQNYDGGFGFLPGSTSYAENCHTCLRALALLDAEPSNPAACRDFILACQTATGGFARINGAAAFLYSTWHAIAALTLLSPPKFGHPEHLLDSRSKSLQD